MSSAAFARLRIDPLARREPLLRRERRSGREEHGGEHGREERARHGRTSIVFERAATAVPRFRQAVRPPHLAHLQPFVPRSSASSRIAMPSRFMNATPIFGHQVRSPFALSGMA